jgi:hypothetical protein
MVKSTAVANPKKSTPQGGLRGLGAQLSHLNPPKGISPEHRLIRGDVFLFHSDDHGFLYDHRNLIIAHPSGCGSRGSFLDRGKTFHHLASFLMQADTCGIALSEDRVRYFTELFRTLRSYAY